MTSAEAGIVAPASRAEAVWSTTVVTEPPPAVIAPCTRCTVPATSVPAASRIVPGGWPGAECGSSSTSPLPGLPHAAATTASVIAAPHVRIVSDLRVGWARTRTDMGQLRV
jgi:hypothetical protein